MSEHKNKSLQVKKQVSMMKGLKMYKQMSQKNTWEKRSLSAVVVLVIIYYHDVCRSMLRKHKQEK